MNDPTAHTPPPGLFARPSMMPPARRNAPAESVAAARSMIGPAAAQRVAMLRAIADAGDAGMTDAEAEALLGMRAQSVSPRRGELATLGLIERDGRRRPTPSGRAAAVWVTTDAGRREAARLVGGAT